MRRSASSLEALDRKSTRLNSSHTEIYTLSLHDALPIFVLKETARIAGRLDQRAYHRRAFVYHAAQRVLIGSVRSEEHTSELQSHRDLHSFPTRRSSDLRVERNCTHRRPTRPARLSSPRVRLSCGAARPHWKR